MIPLVLFLSPKRVSDFNRITKERPRAIALGLSLVMRLKSLTLFGDKNRTKGIMTLVLSLLQAQIHF